MTTGATAAVRVWGRGTGDFPYAEVLEAFLRRGKHRVPPALLAALAEARAARPGQLSAFLGVLLDKRDGRYDYRSYLALPLLDTRRRDPVVALLLADLARFEIAPGADLPEQRPDPELRRKRLKHVLRAVRPALQRLGLTPEPAPAATDPFPAGAAAGMPRTPVAHPASEPLAGPEDEARQVWAAVATDPLQAGGMPRTGLAHPASEPLAAPEDEARQVWAAVAARAAPEDLLALRTSMLPVDTVHDEYLFLRVLQAFEMTFAELGRDLERAVAALGAGESRLAAEALCHAADLLRETSPLWSVIATMRVSAFQRFREHTEGASAIQSRHYKLLESLARRPEGERLGSAAYTSVPEVRERVLSGAVTVDAAYGNAVLTPGERERVRAAMADFAGALTQWRRTHHRIAVRMLGPARSGTGYTAGTPYLAEARSIPVFLALAVPGKAGHCPMRDARRTVETSPSLRESP